MKCCPDCHAFFPDDLKRCPYDYSILKKLDDPFIGKIVGGCYRIKSKIGKGGMGFVYLAQHLYLKREVAIKILRENLSKDSSARERFIREAKICAKISHPHIVKVYDMIPLNGSICIVMEKLEGKTLKEEIKECKLFEIKRALRIISMIADGLSRAHSLEIVHRDIKPSNIFLTAHSTIHDYVKILDFGIAYHPRSSKLTKTGVLIGTPAYLSPERIKGQKATTSSDIYSIGCILYQMLTGKPPFASTAVEEILMGHLEKKPVSINEIRSDCPPAINHLVTEMLEKDPGERPQDGAQLLRKMKQLGIETSRLEDEFPSRRSDKPYYLQMEEKNKMQHYFNNLSSAIGAETTKTIEFRKGISAISKLSELEKQAVEIVSKMEEFDKKRVSYQSNIASAIENLSSDLCLLRSEREKSNLVYVRTKMEEKYLMEKLRNMLGEFSTHYGSIKDQEIIPDKTIEMLIEVGREAKALQKVKQRAKKTKELRGTQNIKLKDLKYQIKELKNSFDRVEVEYNENYEKYRNQLDEISKKIEEVKQQALAVAIKFDSNLKQTRSRH